jgi:hypothetical protein
MFVGVCRNTITGCNTGQQEEHRWKQKQAEAQSSNDRMDSVCASLLPLWWDCKYRDNFVALQVGLKTETKK